MTPNFAVDNNIMKSPQKLLGKRKLSLITNEGAGQDGGCSKGFKLTAIEAGGNGDQNSSD